MNDSIRKRATFQVLLGFIGSTDSGPAQRYTTTSFPSFRMAHRDEVKLFLARGRDIVIHKYAILIGTATLIVTPAAATDIVYKPISPFFGGDPLYTSHLQFLANAQNLHKPKANTSSTKSESQQFLAMLEARLYSSLASKVAEAIFGDNAQKEGTIIFDDQQVHFVNTGAQIELTVTDFLTGKVTTISIPVLQN